MSKIKNIGICTTDGDCPGLNAVIRAVVKASTGKGWEVYGIPDGIDGFLDIARGKYQISDLKLREHGYELPGLLHGLDLLQFLSGSILGAASKANPREAEIAQEIIQGYQVLQLDALIAIAGDKSLDLFYDLAQQGGWNLIAIPKTINNDIPLTESSVGFDTAVNIATNALYNLTFTAASHERVMVVQLMGRDAGHLALNAGIAGGADCILIPEITPQLTPKIITEICQCVTQLRQQGRNFALIVIAEAVRNLQGEKEKDIGDYLANCLREYSNQLCHSQKQEYCQLSQLDTRSCVLGHLQRSAIPTSFDRLMAILFGIKAVDLISHDYYSQMVIWKNGNVESISLDKVIPMIKWSHQENHCSNPVDPSGFMVQTAHALGIAFGDLSDWGVRNAKTDSNSPTV